MRNCLFIISVSLFLLSCVNENRPTDLKQEVLQEREMIVLNEENFPDFNFRDAICRQLSLDDGDTIPDNVLSSLEELQLRDLGIRSLDGIELFPKLRQIDCSGNLLEVLDVSKNVSLQVLECARNQLLCLDLTHNSLLEALGCSRNKLKSINVSMNPKLQHLLCNGNPIELIDVSHNPELRELGVVDCKLVVLDVTNNPLLENLYCAGNKLKELDLRSNMKMNNLYCKQPVLRHINIFYPSNNPNLGRGMIHWSDDLLLLWHSIETK